MKRILVPLALVIALAVPAPAAAATRSYSGDVGGAATLSFTLKKRQGKSTVKDFLFEQVPVQCAAGANTTSGHLTFGMKVEGKKFGAKAEDGAGSELQVDGKLKQQGKQARGTLRVHGAVPTDDGGRGTNCDTGVLHWNAARD